MDGSLDDIQIIDTGTAKQEEKNTSENQTHKQAPTKKAAAKKKKTKESAKAASPVVSISTAPSENMETSETEEYEVEALMDTYYDFVLQQRFFLVKWEGYPHSDNTWEPEKNCTYANEKVGRFWRKHKEETVRAGTEGGRIIYNKVKAALEGTGARILKARSGYLKDPLDLQFDITRDVQEQRAEQAAKTTAWLQRINKAAVSFGETPLNVQNEVDLDTPPEDFDYIETCRLGPGATGEMEPVIMCGAGCVESGCGPGRPNCCLEEDEEPLPFDKDGRLQIPIGRPIFECNSRCACNLNCPSRRTHHPRSIKMTVFKSKHKGWAIKTDEAIGKGTFITEYVGEIIGTDEAEKRGIEYDELGENWLFDLDFVNADVPLYAIDAKQCGNASHFFNHSGLQCEPNLSVHCAFSDNQNQEMPRVVFFAARDIKAGEELTFNYSYESQRGDPREAITKTLAKIAESSDRGDLKRVIWCACGSVRCRRILTT